MTHTHPASELRIGLAAWGAFILATCAYCLLHQAFVSAVTPNFGRTLGIAMREWGAWALLAPWALRVFHSPGTWRDTLLRCVLLALAAASLPIAADLITQDRAPGASLALFWPRNFAMAVALLCLARMFSRAPRDAEQPAGKPRTLLVHKGADQCLILIDDIQYLSAAGNYVDICARDQRYLIRATMAEVAAMLPADDFVRTHRSHVIRVNQIERIRVERSGSGTVHLRGGRTLPISKGYRTQLKRSQEMSRPSIH
jgi:two-component system, LytTR family, response regulator